MDLALDKDLNIVLDGTNDLKTVDKQDELEQSIGIAVYQYMEDGIGNLDREDTRKRLTRKARRVARDNRFIDMTVDISSKWDEDKPNTLVFQIAYGSDELSEMEINV